MEITLKELEKKNPKFWFIDFDCTLTKSLDPIVKELNKRYNKNIKSSDIKSWNFSEIQEGLMDNEIEDLFSLEYFFNDLQFYDGAKEFLISHSDNCMIITKGTSNNIYRKREWLNLQNLSNIKMIGLPLNIDKDIINMNKYFNSVFIDDGTYNLNVSNAFYKVQFREYDETNWNKNWNGYIMRSWT